MSALNDFLDACCAWISTNWEKIVFSVVGVLIVYVVYRAVVGQIARLKDQRKLEENLAFTLKRILQWISVLAILAVIIAQLGIDVGLIVSLLALAGGTIIGFAAMNTIGNAIAGIIVMTSRPFRIG
ncbi:MAG: mechanosensitive ion channel family protein, partial [Candidatus Bathyarchaeota archaeon]|nr:mechanosensitive ion channel family protein [Candidatus Bathyarchaeota archaeon]